MNDREWRAGERKRITRIETDPDSYRVIHYEGGFAVGVGKQWFDSERPAVGRYLVVGANRRDLHVEDAL